MKPLLELPILASVVLAASGIFLSGTAVQASGEVFRDSFQEEALGNWAQAPDDTEIPKEHRWLVVPDPDSADDKQKVLCTPDMATQTYLYHIEPKVVAGSGLVLSFRFNADQTNHEWNTSWTLFTAPILNAAYLVDGYSVRLGFSGNQNDSKASITISRVDPEAGRGNFTELAAATLPVEAYQPGWNTVKFHWKTDGTLKVILNGKEVVSANDTTYEPAFRSLANATWLSNNLKCPESLPDGRKLYFDDIQIDEIDL